MWEVGAATIMVMLIWLLYRASIDLDDMHWPMKAGFFYGSIVLGWAALGVALRLALDNSASEKINAALSAVYGGYITLGILAFGYLIIKFVWWASASMMLKRQAAHEEEKMW